jgi:DNA-binding transcriptional MerR regulator/methylmalonyl-CoA mutase cobalamin-binding subunit
MPTSPSLPPTATQPNPAWLPPALALSIAAVERDTGLSKDTLRVWERRYGFPRPDRDAVGERLYPPAQVEKLRIVKRLLDAGNRPGRIVPLAIEELQQLAEQTTEAAGAGDERERRSPELGALIESIRRHDATGLRGGLMRLQSRLGVGRFVTEVVAPLNVAIGDAWLRGQVQVFEEHLYTETVQVVLRLAIAGLPEPGAAARPQVLLTTFPGEEHGLGLLMAEAMFALEGCRCVSLGVQTPLWDIVQAGAAFGADIVALGFTGCMSPHQTVDALTELRSKLPAQVRIWAGGSTPVLHRRQVAGVEAIARMDDLPAELQRWRAQARSPSSSPVRPVA